MPPMTHAVSQPPQLVQRTRDLRWQHGEIMELSERRLKKDVQHWAIAQFPARRPQSCPFETKRASVSLTIGVRYDSTATLAGITTPS